MVIKHGGGARGAPEKQGGISRTISTLLLLLSAAGTICIKRKDAHEGWAESAITQDTFNITKKKKVDIVRRKTDSSSHHPPVALYRAASMVSGMYEVISHVCTSIYIYMIQNLRKNAL